MLDLEHARRRYRALSLEELLCEAILNAADYREEARAVMAEELALRVGDLRAHLDREAHAVGETVARLPDVKNFGRGSERYGGTLVLTTSGVGFEPSARDEDPVLGAGLIYAAIRERVDDAERLTQPRALSLPLPLLARVYQSVLWLPREHGLSVELDGAVCRLLDRKGRVAWGLVDDRQAAQIEEWGMDTGVPVQRKATESLRQLLGRWFGKGR